MDNEIAVSTLSALLGKTLQIHTTDTRMFVGQMKCTDKVRNIILGITHEYRLPSDTSVTQAAVQGEGWKEGKREVSVDMRSRYVGLVVVPGVYITRIGVEEVDVGGAE